MRDLFEGNGSTTAVVADRRSHVIAAIAMTAVLCGVHRIAIRAVDGRGESISPLSFAAQDALSLAEGCLALNVGMHGAALRRV